MSQPTIRHTGPQVITGVCTCKICNAAIAGAPAAMLIDTTQSAKQNTRVANYAAALLQHLEARHPQVLADTHREQLQFFSMRALQNFKIHDPSLVMELDQLRWQIHQATWLHTFSDASIAGASEAITKRIFEAMELDPQDRPTAVYDLIAQCLTDTRNLLQEPGKYTVIVPT